MNTRIQKPFLQMWVRPVSKPTGHIPLGVRSVGHYRVAPPFVCHITIKHFIQLFWCVEGVGTIFINGVERRLKPRQVALYLPGMQHKWYPHRGFWEFRWLTLDGPLAMPLTVAFGLTANIYEAGPAPVDLFQQLEANLRNLSKQAELNASALAFQILTLVASHPADQTDPLVALAIEQIHQQWNHADFNVKQLASQLGANRFSLSRRFQRITGITPMEYIARLRIQNALLMLKNTNNPVAEIAAAGGYTDPNYFSRLIHRITGVSPRQYRLNQTPEIGHTPELRS